MAIKLTYFNSGSARALMELLDQLDEAAVTFSALTHKRICRIREQTLVDMRSTATRSAKLRNSSVWESSSSVSGSISL